MRRNITIKAVRRPEVDIDRLVHAVLLLVREQVAAPKSEPEPKEARDDDRR